ncbi:MAG: fatty-acid oxidation protein subunit alpha, partial [Leptospiraceae bacterium]|nr:fatty-acid oxidation protein subunit alpha [Leptospiraceae bacterium]
SSIVNEFNSALGQYLGYLQIILKKEPDRFLYLAIPKDVKEKIMTIDYYKNLIQKYKLKILVYEPNNEVISEWIN